MLAFFIFTASCGGKRQKPDTGFTNDAILFNISSDKKLNLFNEKAHTIHIVVYQLNNPNSFTQLIQDENGLTRLLIGEIFDASVTFVDNITVYPDSKKSYSLNRAEGTKYVGIVAGYTIMDKNRMVRVYKIPIVKKRKILSLSFKKEEIIKPLKVNFIFGPQQITMDEYIEE